MHGTTNVKCLMCAYEPKKKRQFIVKTSPVFLYMFHKIITFSTTMSSSYLHCWQKRSSAYSALAVWNMQQYNSVSAKQGLYYYLVGCRLTSAVFSLVRLYKAITYICIVLYVHVLGIFCAHHQEWPLPRKRPHNLHETYQMLSVQLITPGDGHRICPKHVQFHDKINFGYLMHLVGYFIQSLSQCTVTWT
jgi:hypothetical protein